MEIWTADYQPFILGGDCYAPIMADVPVSGPFDIGHGFQAYLAVAPNGRTFVAEATTGAIVGPTIKKVREDVASGKKRFMDQQVAEAKELRQRARTVTPDHLWERLGVSEGEEE